MTGHFVNVDQKVNISLTDLCMPNTDEKCSQKIKKQSPAAYLNLTFTCKDMNESHYC